jgi:ABC-type molybdate transport system ATPase subunit
LFNFNKVPQTAELEITGFEDGGTSTNRVISVSGTVHNPVEGDTAFLGYVHLVLNETNYDMSVTHITEDDWKIQHDVVIKNGTNKLRIKVYNSDSNLVEESPEFTLNGNLMLMVMVLKISQLKMKCQEHIKWD